MRDLLFTPLHRGQSRRKFQTTRNHKNAPPALLIPRNQKLLISLSPRQPPLPRHFLQSRLVIHLPFLHHLLHPARQRNLRLLIIRMMLRRPIRRTNQQCNFPARSLLLHRRQQILQMPPHKFLIHFRQFARDHSQADSPKSQSHLPKYPAAGAAPHTKPACAAR